MSFRLGPLEIGIILVIVLIIFGVGKLPQVSEAIGKGLRSLRRGKGGDQEGKETTLSQPKVISRLEDDEATQRLAEKIAKDRTEPKAG